jgi:hypothetical protein
VTVEPLIPVDTAGEFWTPGAAELLDDVAGFVQRFVVLSAAQARTVALWVAHTHAFEAADATPYLLITSAEKRSGKTRLLEILELLVRQPLPAANISDAALFRAIAELAPTLLLDEVDAIFGAKAREREDLRGLLCAGYRRGAVARRMGGARMTSLESFPVFCPKAFAAIGTLPETISDRGIPIRLERKSRAESVERFRRRSVTQETEVLRERVEVWAASNLDVLHGAWPALPDDLDDRAQDVWEPLLAIADVAGGVWPDRARRAALELSTGEQREDDSLRVRLLADIHSVFERCDDRLKTHDMLVALADIEESPWGEWYGRPLTARGLSNLLKPFRIKTMAVKVEGETVRGYKREQFEDAWSRYLVPVGVTGVTAVTDGSAPDAASNGSNASNAHPNGSGPAHSLDSDALTKEATNAR